MQKIKIVNKNVSQVVSGEARTFDKSQKKYDTIIRVAIKTGLFAINFVGCRCTFVVIIIITVII